MSADGSERLTYGPLDCMTNVREAISGSVELARTFGLRGLARRAVHEALLRSRAYEWAERESLPDASPLRLLSLDLSAASKVLGAFPIEAQGTVERARQLLRGYYPFFGDRSLEIGWPPRWHEHPTTGVPWPPNLHWSAYARTPVGYGDIKWIWEPARFHFAWLFPRAWMASGDPRFAHETWRGLRDWMENNPPGQGAGWYCAQELSLRCIAIMFAASVFHAEGLCSAEEMRRISRLLHLAARRIARTLRHSLSQRNNHALTEAVTLWTIAQVLPAASESPEWRVRAERALEECVTDQFGPDGAYIQESLNYQRLAVHVLLWARFVARSFASPLSGNVESALRRSHGFLMGLRPVDGGALPNYGHNDGALLLGLSSSNHRDFRPTLQHLARELGEPPPFFPGPWDEQGAWFGFGPTTREVAPPPRDSLRITSSGYVSSHRGPWMIASRVPVHAHHRPGHADSLHLDVWHGPRNVALDPGSFAYSEPAPWDNGLSETRVHNTCSVGDRSQMRRRGRFLWTHWSRAELLVDIDQPGVSVWMARVRCAWGRTFIHTRLVRHCADRLDVFDDVRGAESDVIRLHWNLEGVKWRQNGLQWDDGAIAVALHAPTVTVRDIRADATTTIGWMSPTYGMRTPCTSIELEAVATRAWFHTVMSASGGATSRLPDEVVSRWRDSDLAGAAQASGSLSVESDGAS